MAVVAAFAVPNPNNRFANMLKFFISVTLLMADWKSVYPHLYIIFDNQSGLSLKNKYSTVEHRSCSIQLIQT